MQQLSRKLETNLKTLDGMFGTSADYYAKKIMIYHCRGCIVLFDGMASLNSLWALVLDGASRQAPPQSGANAQLTGEQVYALILQDSAFPAESSPVEDLPDLVKRLTAGMAVLLLDGCAKGIAFMAVNDGDINDYIFNRKVSDNALPLIVIPTTCGTGSEGNGFGVLTNPKTGDKKSLRCNAIVPKVSIVDPGVMGTMPPHVLASVGFDALCHNIEAYTSKTAQPFTDALAHYAVTLLAQHLVPLYKHVKAAAEGKPAVLNEKQLTKAWEAVTLASTMGGMVINTAGVTLAHGMEHPASGLKDITHGVGLAVIEPVAVEYTWSANPDKFGALARIFNHGDGSELGEALRLIVHDLDLTTNLTELGFTKKDIPWLVDNVYVVATGNIANTVAKISRKDIEALYKKMF